VLFIAELARLTVHWLSDCDLKNKNKPRRAVSLCVFKSGLCHICGVRNIRREICHQKPMRLYFTGK